MKKAISYLYREILLKVKEELTKYYPEFYVEDISDNGSVYNLFKPSNDIMEIVDKTKDIYCVTGFLIDDGRVIYYDQYL